MTNNRTNEFEESRRLDHLYMYVLYYMKKRKKKDLHIPSELDFF